MRDRDAVQSEQLWAMVDVELLVVGGAPREVFHLVEHIPGRLPSWRLDVDALRRLGWTFDGNSISPPPGDDDDTKPFANHPYALGAAWRGGNRWEATFQLAAGSDVAAVVTHELLIDDRNHADPGPPLRSQSPWVWWIHGLSAGDRAGRAESPVLAAAAAERLLVSQGIAIAEPTVTLRSRLDGTPLDGDG